jgi:hypothetical protein
MGLLPWLLPLPLLLLSGGSEAAIAKDRVLTLPGLGRPLPAQLYSGYIEASPGHMLHYVFMESWSSPSTDPVAVWMNGGPGSSSMGGLLTELGPFVTSDDSFPNGPSTGPYTVQLNNYSWNVKASMIYLEQPAGVGFSFCNKSAPFCNFSDITQADDTFSFLVKFFDEFPEFVSNEFFLTAESYGGVYVPTLAHNLLTRPNNLNFKGIAIGNPSFRQSGWNYPSEPGQPDPTLSPREQVHAEFFFGHGQYSPATHRKINAACDWEAAAKGNKPSSECKAMIDQMSEEIGGCEYSYVGASSPHLRWPRQRPRLPPAHHVKSLLS